MREILLVSHYSLMANVLGGHCPHLRLCSHKASRLISRCEKFTLLFSNSRKADVLESLSLVCLLFPRLVRHGACRRRGVGLAGSVILSVACLTVCDVVCVLICRQA